MTNYQSLYPSESEFAEQQKQFAQKSFERKQNAKQREREAEEINNVQEGDDF